MLKNNKGMTVISLLIYIIVLTVVIGSMSIVMRYFYKNADDTIISNDTAEQYSRFIAYITSDINSGKINNIELVSATDIKLNFSDGTVQEYQFNEGTIYYIVINSQSVEEKKIQLCKDLSNCEFIFNNAQNKITTHITIGGITYNNNFTVK